MKITNSVFLFILAAAAAVTATSGKMTTITGTIYCDNYFEFWFNGKLIAKDPLFFTPHQAVRVQFEWDGVSDKTYAIMCQDFATESGYEYIFGEDPTGKPPWIGDGALIAEFDDGTVTNDEWKVFVNTNGPTQASIDAGCTATNLEVCEVEEFKEPANWFDPNVDVSDWQSASIFTEEEAGWGIEPKYGLPTCGKATNPFTRVEMGPVDGFAINYADSVPTLSEPWTYDENQVFSKVNLTDDECLIPVKEFDGSKADFIWATDLKLDNRVLFRLDVPCSCEGVCGKKEGGKKGKKCNIRG